MTFLRNFIFQFFSVSFSLTLFADESPSLCSVGLAAISLPTQAERIIFETKPEALRAKYKLGLLVGLESGSKILGLGHYLSGHESIKREIENRYGDIDEYFWGGEILMLLSMEYPNGYFTKINETCGLINDLQKNSPQNGHEPSKLNNSSQFVERALNGSCSHYHNGHHVPQFLNWSRERPQHLHPKLADSDVNLRHSILNSFFIIRSFGIDFLFRYPLHPEARKTILLLEKLLDLFDENDFDAELMNFLRDAHQVILNQESLNLRESLRLEAIYSALEKQFHHLEENLEVMVVDEALASR